MCVFIIILALNITLEKGRTKQKTFHHNNNNNAMKDKVFIDDHNTHDWFRWILWMGMVFYYIVNTRTYNVCLCLYNIDTRITIPSLLPWFFYNSDIFFHHHHHFFFFSFLSPPSPHHHQWNLKYPNTKQTLNIWNLIMIKQ